MCATDNESSLKALHTALVHLDALCESVDDAYKTSYNAIRTNGGQRKAERYSSSRVRYYVFDRIF